MTDRIAYEEFVMSGDPRSLLEQTYEELLARGILPTPVPHAGDFEYPNALIPVDSLATDGDIDVILESEVFHAELGNDPSGDTD